MKNRFSLLITTLISQLIISGCYFNSSYEDIQPSEAIAPTLQPNPIEIVNSGKQQHGDFLSGSLILKNTPLRNYKILASAGTNNNKIQIKTAKGYKVFFSDSGIIMNNQSLKK